MAMLNNQRVIEEKSDETFQSSFFRDSVIHFGVQTMVQPSLWGAFDPSGDCKVLPSPVAQCPHAGKIGIPMDSPRCVICWITIKASTFADGHW